MTKPAQIQLIDVTHRYQNKTIDGLSNINLKLKAGQIYFLVGPSGSGKSTLVNILANQIKINQGSYSNPLKCSILPSLSDSNRDDSVYRFLCEEDNSEEKDFAVRQLLLDLDMTNHIYKKINLLSTGQQQRVLLAKILLEATDFILLDEPFAHLDHQLRAELIELFIFHFKQKNIGALWVTHQIEEALSFADKLIVLNHGKIIQMDTPEVCWHKPNRLFVAKFICRANAVVGEVTSVGQDHIIASTPLGIIKLEKLYANEIKIKQHILIIIRPDQFIVDERGELAVQINKIKLNPYFFELEGLINNQVLSLALTYKPKSTQITLRLPTKIYYLPHI